MGGKNKGQSGGTQTQMTTPFLQEQAKQFGAGAQGWYETSAPAIAQFSDISQGGFDAARQIFPQASQQLGQTIGGEFLGANPYLQDVAARAQQGAMSGINATFGGAGRTGGGLHQQSLAEGLGNVAAGIYAPAYEAERSRMLAATQMAPQQLAGQLGIGGVMEAKDLEQQLAPYTQLQQYGQLINMPGGGHTTSQLPDTPGRGVGAGIAGGAALGASVGGPWGAVIGGSLGGLGII